jgi:hypothetical protein
MMGDDFEAWAAQRRVEAQGRVEALDAAWAELRRAVWAERWGLLALVVMFELVIGGVWAWVTWM